jgi:HAMP domain-containing protein/GAF domain-containing protein
MIRLQNLSIEVKQGLIIAMLVAANCTLFFSLYKLHSFQTQYTNTIYLLERQASLLEFIASEGSDTSANKKVYECMTLFHRSLNALQKGGAVEGMGSKIYVQATNDERLTALLQETRQIWNVLEEQTQKNTVKANVPAHMNSLLTNNTLLTERYTQSFKSARNVYTALVYGACGIVIISLFLAIYLFRRYFKKPVNSIMRTLERAAAGDLSQQTHYNSQDEIGRLAGSVDRMVQNQLYLSAFAEKIGEGKFDSEQTEMNAGDKLGLSLATMREKLQKVSTEDKKRIWATEGMAKFSDILRSANDNIQLLSEQIIINLVKYLNANQGGLFILYDDAEQQPYLELTATYAWNRKKSINKRIEYGEGLVGQVVRDKDTVYMTDIPESYITITSGLGKANPGCLLIVPLKVNNEIHGVIELASFHEFQPFEVEFVEKLSESIAATLSSVKTNEKTRKLLDEARMMNEHMRSQEEEMRQNLEELSSTQEEMQRKEVELTGLFSSINNTLATIEFDLDGFILTANENFCRMMQYSAE